jgi:hypothetical protein
MHTIYGCHDSEKLEWPNNGIVTAQVTAHAMRVIMMTYLKEVLFVGGAGHRRLVFRRIDELIAVDVMQEDATAGHAQPAVEEKNACKKKRNKCVRASRG